MKYIYIYIWIYIYIYNPLNSFSISKYTHPPAPIGETRCHPPHCDHQWWLLATDGRESAGVRPWCAKATWYREENQEEVQTRFFQHQEFWVHHECRQNEECQTFHHRMAMQAPLGFKNQTSHDFFWQNQGNYNMSIQCWAWGFGMTYQSVRLDCSSNGLKTIVPIRPIACLSGVLDLQEAHVRIFWVGFFCCLAGYQHGR